MRLIRRSLRLTKGRITTISQERQKLSFFFVVIFLAVFGLILLAEVLFVDSNGNAFGVGSNGGGGGNGRHSLYYDDNGSGDGWEGPAAPNVAAAAAPATIPVGLRWVLGGQGPSSAASFDNSGGGRQRNGRFQKSLDRHRGEMESLIRNMSSMVGGNSTNRTAVNQGRKITPATPAVPYNYTSDFLPSNSFDFTLRRHTGVDNTWQPVNGTRHKFYVYSAFYDGRAEKRVVRVIGATKTKKPERVWCRLYYKNHEKDEAEEEEEDDDDDDDQAFYEEGASISQNAARVLATVAVIRENWNLKYSAVFVLCPLPPGDEFQIPDSVSVIVASEDDSRPYSPPTNQLRVLNRDVDTKEKEDARLKDSDEIGICVKPIHFGYNRTLDLIEFLELNKLLGVTHFTLYNHTMSPEVSCLLRDYVSRGEVELLPFDLNMISQKEIRTEGLFAALNDCLYRNMWRFNYLMLIDLDEFVVPRHNRSLPAMLRHLEYQKAHLLSKGRGGITKKLAGEAEKKVVSAYSFQNAFFYTQYSDDEQARNLPSSGTGGTAPRWLPLRTLVKTKRKVKFNPQRQRSKYVCVPRRIREVGNHFIWEFSEGINLYSPVSVGFLHHYRVCEFGGDACADVDYKVDRTTYRYRDDLLNKVGSKLEELRDVCGLDYLLQAAVEEQEDFTTATTPTPLTKVRTKRIGDGGELTGYRRFLQKS